MKKVFISSAVIFASALGMQVSAQQAQTGGSKEYNVHYTIDVPSTTIAKHDKKIMELDKQFKAFEAAVNSNDKATAKKLKASIVKWPGDNFIWIDGLERHLKDAVNGWYEAAFSSLRVNDEIK